jgi:hypothetical protein
MTSQATKPDKAVRTNDHLYDELKKDAARLMEERDLLRETLFRTHGFWSRAWIIVWHYYVRCYLPAVARITQHQSARATKLGQFSRYFSINR